jgi:hypothetical protein
VGELSLPATRSEAEEVGIQLSENITLVYADDLRRTRH